MAKKTTPKTPEANHVADAPAIPAPPPAPPAPPPSPPLTPSEEVALLVAAITALAGPALALTATDRKRSVRLRKGGEKVIPTILALANQFGVTVASHPTGPVAADIAKAQQLAPIQKQLVTAEKQVSDAIFSAESRAWEAATVLYSILKRLAKTNGDLATALAPVAQFFAKKSPAVVKAREEKRGGRKGTKKKAAPGGASEPAATPEPATPANGTPKASS
jgi:hypothetical protein